MNWKHVKLIFTRELRDQLRDRRTLFTITILPILLYPLMGMLMLQVAQFSREHPVRIKILGTENIPESPQLIDGEQLYARVGLENIAPLVTLSSNSLPKEESDDELQKQATEWLNKGEQDLIVIFKPRFREYMERLAQTQVGDQVDGDWLDDSDRGLEVILTRSRDQSQIAYNRWQIAIEVWQQEWISTKLKGAGFDPRLVRPLHIAPVDVAPEATRRAIVWSKILPFIMLIWALTGAFYPAVDLCAGEKERGTLETLLSSPARRREIVWGKLLTVIFFSCMTALLNLGSMQFTASLLSHQLAASGARGLAESLGTPPIYAIGWLTLALIPMASLFSALALAVAALARSTKEGQYYLMPLLLMMLPFVMIPMLPGIELSLGTALMPVTGMVLLSRALVEGQYLEAIRFLPIVAVVTITCCLLAIRWAVRQFESESVMFRENERWDIRMWITSIWRERDFTASVMEAMLCGAIILVARFFASLATTEGITDFNGLLKSVLVSQLALILTPALLMAIMLTKSLRTSLRLKPPRAIDLLVCALLAVCFHPLAIWFSTAVSYVYPVSPAMMEATAGVTKAIIETPWWMILLTLAILPAFCEEIAFRGFIFGGLLRQNGVLRAILVSAIFFGLTHGLLQQSIAATFMGLLLGWVAWRTGGIVCTIVMHVIHNSMSILLARAAGSDTSPAWLDLFVQFDKGGFTYGTSWTTVSIVLAIACVWILYMRSSDAIVASESRAADSPIAD
jgi:sodium transport system permease protein